MFSNVVQQKRNFNASAVALPAQPNNDNTLLIVLEDKAATGVRDPAFVVKSGPNGSQVWTKIGELFPSNPGGSTGLIEEWKLEGPFNDTVGGVVYSPGGRSAPPLDALLMEMAP